MQVNFGICVNDFFAFTASLKGEEEPGPNGDERRGYLPIRKTRKGRESG
jgi:hypothetical protein